MTYPSKTPEAQRSYRQGIPKELKKIYQERYEMKQKLKKSMKSKNQELRRKKEFVNYILGKLIEKCRVIQESESLGGSIKLVDRYLSQKDIERCLKSIL